MSQATIEDLPQILRELHECHGDSEICKDAIAILEQLQAREARLCSEICAAIKAADDESMKDDYMLDSDDCIRVVREYFAKLTSQEPGK